MANNIQTVKKDDFTRFFSDYEKKHATKEIGKATTFTKALGNGEHFTETTFADGVKIFVEKRKVRETASTTLNGLDFTLEIPMIRYEYWASDSNQHRCYYEKER